MLMENYYRMQELKCKTNNGIKFAFEWINEVINDFNEKVNKIKLYKQYN